MSLSNSNHVNSNLKRSALVGWGWNILFQAVTVVSSALIFFVSSRYLSPDEFGLVAFSSAIVAFVSAVMPTAFGQALVQREHVEERHLSSTFWLCALFATIAYAAIFLLAPFVARLQTFPLMSSIVIVLSSKILFDGLGAVPNALLQRRMNFRALAVRSILANFISAAACFGLIYAGLPLWGLVLSQTLAPFVSMVASIYVAGWYPRQFGDRSSIEELSGFGIFALGGQFLSQAKIDQILLGIFIGPIGLGLYYFAQRIYSICLDLTGNAFAVVGNSIFALVQKDISRRKSIFDFGSFAATTIGFPVFVGLFVISPSAVPLLFGEQWVDAISILRCLCVMGVMASLGVVQGSMITYLGYPEWWFRYQLISQSVGWTIIIAISSFGITKVVVALAIRTILIWPASIYKTMKILDISIGDYVKGFAGPLFSALSMGAALLFFEYCIDQHGKLEFLLLQIFIGAFCYLLCLFLSSRKQLINIFSAIKKN